MKESPPEKREGSFGSVLVTESIDPLSIDHTHLSGGDLFITSLGQRDKRPAARLSADGPEAKSVDPPQIVFGTDRPRTVRGPS